MRVLVVSRSPWRNDNSFGNTYSNIFDGIKDIEIANIYLADGNPDFSNSVVKRYYQISESKIIKSVLKSNKKVQVGHEVIRDTGIERKNESSFNSQIGAAKKKRWSIFFIIRELFWKLGNVNWEDMMCFVRSFNPDIIFCPLYYAVYVDRVIMYIKARVSCPLVLEASIDIYSLRQLSFDPFYWLNRFSIRSATRKIVGQAEKLYVISDKMKNEYSSFLNIDCSVLYKFPDISRMLSTYSIREGASQLLFLYTGNIGDRRWATLGELGKIIHDRKYGKLVIYTPTPITSKMRKALSNCELHSPVDSEKVKELQASADILVHAESFDLKNRLWVRYSISTKIMDYISAGRCILAIGPTGIASIEFLNDNDLALVCSTKHSVARELELLFMDINKIKIYADKARRFVETYPTRMESQKKLIDELNRIVVDYNN